MTTLIETLSEGHGDEIEAIAQETKPREYCKTQRYEEFVVRELLDRALIELIESGQLANLLSTGE